MTKIGIIGAGVVGGALGNWLLAEGHEVRVFERQPEGKPASAGNAGLLAFPEIFPLANPSTLMSAPGWLFDPLGPLSLRLRDTPALTPWLFRYAASAMPGQVKRGTAALTWLMSRAEEAHVELAKRLKLESHILHSQLIAVRSTSAGVQNEAEEAEESAHALGTDFDVLTVEQARELVPQLEGKFAGAVLHKSYKKVADPQELLTGLRTRLLEAGALVSGEVKHVTPTADKIIVHLASGETEEVDRIAVTGGVWSRDIIRQLGLKVSLETERGYNTTFGHLGWELPMPISFAEHGFMAVPLSSGLRVGGAVELARHDAPPNYARSRAMCERMRRYVPSLPHDGGEEWMGCRPSTPDSVPVIGPHPNDPRIVFGFGHGHLGLTFSAITAKLMTNCLVGNGPEPELDQFSIKRFQ